MPRVLVPVGESALMAHCLDQPKILTPITPRVFPGCVGTGGPKFSERNNILSAASICLTFVGLFVMHTVDVVT